MPLFKVLNCDSSAEMPVQNDNGLNCFMNVLNQMVNVLNKAALPDT